MIFVTFSAWNLTNVGVIWCSQDQRSVTLTLLGGIVDLVLAQLHGPLYFEKKLLID